jgi:hypothetical protein
MSALRALFLVVGVTVTIGNYGSSLAADDQVDVHETRPLGKLVGQLWTSHKYLITYEEGPYDPDKEVFTETHPNGKRFRYPAWKPITFHGIPPKDANADYLVPEQQTAAALTVAESAVAEYNSSGNPGRFQVLKDGDYVHIIPAGIRRNGNIVDFQPILDTRVTFLDSMPRLCLYALNDLVSQLENLRGIHIITNVPANALLRHQCQINGIDMTARSAFEEFVHQIEPPKENWVRLRYSWTVGYDLQEDIYFLTLYPLWIYPPPASTTNAAPAPAPAAKDNAGGVFPAVPIPPSLNRPTGPAR